MKPWLCVLVVLVATVVRIQTTKSHEDSQSDHHIFIRSSVDEIVLPNHAPDIFKAIEITVEGEYSWEKIYYVDNRKQNKPYKETRKVTKTVQTSYTDLKKSIVDVSVKTSANLDVDGVFEVLTASVIGSMDPELMTSYQSMVEQKSEITLTEELTRDITVAANSNGEIFRLVYKGPGLTYSTGIISTDNTQPLDKVFITCQVKQVPLIKDIRVVYKDENNETPQDAITETFGGSADINKGFGGKYVWLIPVWTGNKNKAVTEVRVVILSEKDSAYSNLAAGTKGKYRYLKLLKGTSHTRITRVGLLRSTHDKYGDRRKYGWDECTEDINKGRQGDFLHLCWNNISV